MDGRRRTMVASHIEAISTATKAEQKRLMTVLMRRSWPGGPADQSHPGSLGWLSRWTPDFPAAEPLECECASGHCQLCN